MKSTTPHSLFRKKPVVVEAMLYTADNCQAIHAWAGLGEHGESSRGPGYYCGTTPLYIETLEGTMQADPGDWIIKGVKGEFYPCKPDIFLMTYERADLPMSEKGQITQAAGESADVPQFASGMESSLAGERPAQNFQFDKRETPRTDALLSVNIMGDERFVLMTDLARELERELAEARADAVRWADEVEDLRERTVSARVESPKEAFEEGMRIGRLGYKTIEEVIAGEEMSSSPRKAALERARAWVKKTLYVQQPAENKQRGDQEKAR